MVVWTDIILLDYYFIVKLGYLSSRTKIRTAKLPLPGCCARPLTLNWNKCKLLQYRRLPNAINKNIIVYGSALPQVVFVFALPDFGF